MGYCKLCRQHQESPDDCDCDRGEDRPPTLEEFLADCISDCVEGT